MDVILVGNSSALLEQSSGSLIDSMDRVVRFNGGAPVKHQEAIGTRTDYWSFSTKNASDYYEWMISGAIPMCLNMRIEYPVNPPNAVGIGNKINLAKLVVYLGRLITLLI